ncbi:MAG: trypsin-like peptidase domain-containing protein [Bacteroidales bacterium]|nr:trypsin-like peptidase domain-containing protein [Bacteroidales bacterium]
MKFKNLFIVLLAAVAGGAIALYGYNKWFAPRTTLTVSSAVPARFASATDSSYAGDAARYPDFTYAAEQSVHAVVHVKTVTNMRQSSASMGSLFDYFFGYPQQPQQPQYRQQESYGSGVIITEDGYIVTNNHVIDGADEVEVTLNDKRVFKAQVAGADPSTDLALLKISASDLPFIVFGDAEQLKVGEWVLAVGNPYNLTSTVTAGIVSAKSRQLGIISDENTQQPSIEDYYNRRRGQQRDPRAQSQQQQPSSSSLLPLESFIQTDAAVNPGNSGGALVNVRGELVGINTAIASQTGSYSGNSFAIPVTIVQKVVSDFLEYGQVQRAILGVSVSENTSENIKERGLSEIKGIYVAEVQENGGAAEAGIEPGDVITAINGVPVNSYSELSEQVGKYRPNDKVTVEVLRQKKTRNFEVTLRNREGSTQVVRKQIAERELGAVLEELTDEEKESLDIRYGVKVKSLQAGKLRSAGVRAGFIIMKVNDKEVRSVADVEEILQKVPPRSRVLLDGMYSDGELVYYAFPR